VNIAWIFFRAKTWDDAIKVLSGMVGLNGIKLGNALAEFSFFQGKGIEFGKLFHDSILRNTLPLMILLIVVLLAAKNSDEMLRKFKPTWKTALFTIVLAAYSLLSMNRVTEFLYFNF
jgi:hypothetical protein